MRIHILLLIFIFLLVGKVNATHLRGGEITVEAVGDDCGNSSSLNLLYRITITVYLDQDSKVLFGNGILNFGDGSDEIIIPEIAPTPRPELGPKVATASYSLTHTYSSAGRYLITYTEPNRNANILNIPSSVQTQFHIETEIVIDPTLGCNDSPVLLIPPIDIGCGGVAFYHNPGAFDPDGDSISFELVSPKSGTNIEILGYKFPADPSLYSVESPFQTGNEDGGPAYFTIDPITGLITWNAPPIPAPAGPNEQLHGDEYNIAFIVREWRKLFGRWVSLGHVRRDMQVIIQHCDNNKPELILPEDICVEAGTLINEEILGIDPDNNPVKIEVFSQVLDLGATYDPRDTFQLIDSEIQGRINFTWQTECSDVRDQAYQIVFKITDQPDEGEPHLVNFATWNVTVVGPSPILETVVNEGKNLRLSWEPYSCSNEADKMQIWRKVDSNPYVPDSCETGIREEAGYKLIAEQPLSTNSYLDTDMALGAKYCYRILAIFNDEIVAESRVSNEVCFEFVPADAPVITNVSVHRTHKASGEINVSWKKPFDLDPSFSGDFHYDILRSVNGKSSFNLVASLVNDTTYKDSGLNTEDNVYFYRIDLRVPNGPVGNEVIGSSAVASSVRLEPTPEFDRISLEWEADVPWSNVIVNKEGEYHYVYRGPDDSQLLNELTLIDSIKVSEAGFVYIDSGQYQSMPLVSQQFYCYSIMTNGTYGNPQIESPLENLSQITCIQPLDTIAPCVPKFTIEAVDCEEFVSNYGCRANQFEHQLTWEPDLTSTCPTDNSDIKHYEVYYASTTDSDYELIDTVTVPSFERKDLASFKGCYKIRAQDRAGNFTEFSEPFCFDNCPNYELPNIITPNGDGCNDQFRPYLDSNPPVDEETGNTLWDCGPQDIIGKDNCKRFVRSVDFTVFNRWGKQVYHYNSDEHISRLRQLGEVTNIQIDIAQNINWPGIHSNGTPLPSGVYYYVARVTFDVVNPSDAVKDIKGWVQVLR